MSLKIELYWDRIHGDLREAQREQKLSESLRTFGALTRTALPNETNECIGTLKQCATALYLTGLRLRGATCDGIARAQIQDEFRISYSALKIIAERAGDADEATQRLLRAAEELAVWTRDADEPL